MTRAWARTLFWLGIVAALGLTLRLLSSILLPFVLSAGIAFFLSPLVDGMARLGLSRTFGSLLVLLAFSLVLVTLALLLIPLLETQVVALVQHFPSYVAAARSELDHGFRLLQDRLSQADLDRLREAASSRVAGLLDATGRVVMGLLTGGIAVANLLSLVFITPVVSFFLLRDWPDIIATLDAWMPRQHLATIREQARLVEETLSGFIRGQATVCLIMAVFYAAGLTLLGIESGLVVGFCVGLLVFIPFLGGLSGAVIAAALAFAQTGSWHKPFYVGLLFALGQSLEGNLITPKLVGDRVHLHPVWVIFSLLAFGAIFGFMGVLIAVPMAAVLGVLLRFALKRYLLSPIYDPLNGPPADAVS